MFFVLVALPAVAAVTRAVAEGVEKWRNAKDLETNKQQKVVFDDPALLNARQLKALIKTNDPRKIERIKASGRQKFKAYEATKAQ